MSHNLPQSIESEQAVLGALMLSETALAKVVGWLNESDFYRDDHRVLFRAIVELGGAGRPHDAVTIADWMASNGHSPGGASYALKLANSTPGSANIEAYAEIVREKARLRELIDAGTKLAEQAMQPRADSSQIASASSNKLSGLVGDPRAGGLVSLGAGVSNWFAAIQRRYDSYETYSGLTTPWKGLNDLTLGLQPGDLIIVAARPNMGKSVMGFQLAAHNALRGQHTAVFSLEMRTEQFVQRSLAASQRIKHNDLRSPRNLSDGDWGKITLGTGELARAPLYLDDQPSLAVAQIVARAKRQHLRAPLSLIVIDHLHEIKRPGRDLVNEIANDVRELRKLAKELKVPIVLLAQLNRSNVGRADHRPTVSDLRASGATEEIGDVILLIHREDYYDRNTHLKGVVELIVAKARDFQSGGSVYLENHFDEMRLDDWIGSLPIAPEKTELPKKSGLAKALDIIPALKGEV